MHNNDSCILVSSFFDNLTSKPQITFGTFLALLSKLNSLNMSSFIACKHEAKCKYNGFVLDAAAQLVQSRAKIFQFNSNNALLQFLLDVRDTEAV